MQIKIKRVDKTLPLPEYHTSGSVAFDFYARVNVTVSPGETMLVPANFIIETPEGYALIIAARSSLAKKKGLKLANGIGVIDQDYCGEEDEISLLIHNYTNQEVVIEKGERLAQGMFVKIEKAKWNEVEKINDKSRGGFGSTGK